MLVIERAPDRPGNELLWVGAAGLGAGRALTSQTTAQPLLVASVDIAPSVLGHLGLAVPSAMRGRPIELGGRFSAAYARRLKVRLHVLYARRMPTLVWLLVAWAVLFAVLTALGRRRAALRIIGLSALWIPVVMLVPAALEPGRLVEKGLIVGLALLFGALTDLVMPWPRGPLLPAVVDIVVLTVDALAHTQLLIRSVLGPNPIFGARFYGIGNELKSGLAVIVFAAVAAALTPSERGRRAAAAMAVAGVVLAAVEGSARVGAGVGGVILVAAGTAVATVLLLPGRLHRGRVLLVLAAPFGALVALALLDLATAHGGGPSPGASCTLARRRTSATSSSAATATPSTPLAMA